METGVVMVWLSDHLPVFAFVGGQGGGTGTPRRVVTGVRIGQFAGRLEGWDWRAVRALGVEENWVRFGDECWDMYNCTFPVAKGKKKRWDVEKPWLDEVDFKE